MVVSLRRDVATYLLMRLGYWLCGVAPQAVMYLLADLMAAVLFALANGKRRVVETNLRQVLGPELTAAEVSRHSRIVFRQAARNYVDILTLGHQTSDEVRRRIMVEGWDNLAETLAAGKGVVLISPHIGNMDVVVQYMALHGRPITVPVEHVKPERLFRFLC